MDLTCEVGILSSSMRVEDQGQSASSLFPSACLCTGRILHNPRGPQPLHTPLLVPRLGTKNLCAKSPMSLEMPSFV